MGRVCLYCVSMYYKVTHGHAMHAENLASQCVRFRYIHMATVVVQRIKLRIISKGNVHFHSSDYKAIHDGCSYSVLGKLRA